MPSPFTLEAAALPAVRSGLDTVLTDVAERLHEALELSDRPWCPFREMQPIAGLLDRVGWHGPGAPAPSQGEPVEITTRGDAQLVLKALAEQLSTAIDQAADGQLDAEEARKAQQKVEDVRRLLTTTEAAAAHAGLLTDREGC